jgi:hypothetical protein
VPRTRWLIGKKGITYNDRGRGLRLLHDKSADERQSLETREMDSNFRFRAR